MRHIPGKQSAGLDVKHDYLESLDEIKEEIPNILLEHCQNLIQSDDSLIEGPIDLDLNQDSDSCDNADPVTEHKTRRRRKSLLPQRAIQASNGENSNENSSESSQEVPELESDNSKSVISSNTGDTLPDINDEDIFRDLNEDNDADLLLEINEEDIFKDLQDEVGEKIDDEIMDNVKEEWRTHWGVKCNMCEQVFSFKVDFDRHYVATYGLTPVYTCTVCNKTAEKYSTFRSHCYRHITEGRYKCKDCQKGFSLQSMLHVHILAKHIKAKPYMCEECGRSFVTKPGLKIHSKKHKSESKEDYPCVVCGKVLHTRGGLTSHMNVHRLGRRFMCDVCGKTFTQKVNMQQHVKQHTGDKPYRCDKCGKTFSEKSHLARHYSFHSDQRPFKCEVCQKMYKTERCLKVHGLVHAAARPFICGYCGKGFLSSTKLKQHYNIHTGERPYKCKYCERTFTNYPNWLKHTRRRHKVDHRTGEGLEAKSSKEDEGQPTTPAPQSTPAVSGTDETPQIPVQQTASEQLLADISLTKTEELILQQGLLNFPISDDKFTFSQSIDLLNGTGTNGSVGLLVPYFPTPLPNHQTIIPHTTSASIPIQFSDLLHAQYIQQT